MAKHGAVKKYAKQHFVPRCYTKPWCDPSAPAGPTNTPCVWQFNADGSQARRKSPAKLFTETDIYAIVGHDGERDLRLEHGFQELEDKFTRIRNLRFLRGEWPDSEQMRWLEAFVATAHARTASFRDFHRDQWRTIRSRMEEMATSMREVTPKQRETMRSMTTLCSSSSGGLGMNEIPER